VECRTITYPNWLRIAMASEMGELDLRKISVASDIEHDWESARLWVSGMLQTVRDEGHVGFCFLGEAHAEEDVDRERAVTDLSGCQSRGSAVDDDETLTQLNL